MTRIIVLFLSTLFAVTSYSAELNIYVDSFAMEDGDGKKRSPYRNFREINWEKVQYSISQNIPVYINVKRGGVWREQLNVQASGARGVPITILPYGNSYEPRPLILGSVDMSKREDWQLIDKERNLWATSVGSLPPSTSFHNSDTGFALFGQERPENVGKKARRIEDLDKPKEYLYEKHQGRVVVYSESNPAQQFEKIELANSRYRYSVLLSGVNYVTIEGLAVKYSSVNAINIENGSQGAGSEFIEIIDCEISYGGGFSGSGARIGAGIHVGKGGGSRHITIRNNKVSQFWDAAIGLESTGRKGGFELYKILVKDNLLETSHAGIYVGAGGSGQSQRIYDVEISGNIISNMGYGWSGYDNDGAFHGRGISVSARNPSKGTVIENVRIEGNTIDTFSNRGINLMGGENYTVKYNTIKNGKADFTRSFAGAFVIHGGGPKESDQDVFGEISDNSVFDNESPGLIIVNNRPLASKGKLNIRANVFSNNKVVAGSKDSLPVSIRASQNYSLSGNSIDVKAH